MSPAFKEPPWVGEACPDTLPELEPAQFRCLPGAPPPGLPPIAPGDPTKASPFIAAVSQEARFTGRSADVNNGLNCSWEREIKQSWVGRWGLRLGAEMEKLVRSQRSVKQWAAAPTQAAGAAGILLPPRPPSSGRSRAALQSPSVESRNLAQSCWFSKQDDAHCPALTPSAHPLVPALLTQLSTQTPQIHPLLVHPEEKWRCQQLSSFHPCSPPLRSPALRPPLSPAA